LADHLAFLFDRVIIVDWSAANAPTSATKLSDSIWIGSVGPQDQTETHHRTRAGAKRQIQDLLDAKPIGARWLIGFDFALGYPHGFANALTGDATAAAVWKWMAEHIEDHPDNRNNRFEVAAQINARFDAPGPYWSHPQGRTYKDLPAKKQGIDYAALGLPEYRQVERMTKGAKSPWMLYNPGSVGSQTLLGLPWIHALAQNPQIAVWPFDLPDAPIVLAEVYPSLLGDLPAKTGLVRDQAQVRLLALALWRLSQTGRLAALFETPLTLAEDEGWILGAGHGSTLREAAAWV
jgi:molybdopterin-guanine dinucleotide biosynthesis protein B